MLKYEKAVELLSAQPNLTAADAKLKTQYEKALATEKNLFDRVANLLMSKNTTGNLPWDVAEEMIPELTARGPGDGASSSVRLSFGVYLPSVIFPDTFHVSEGVGYPRRT
jgi:hypothetical protein